MQEGLNDNKVCIYDGITMTTRDPGTIEYILGKAEKYNLRGGYDIATNTALWKFSGRYRNFTISSSNNKKGRGIRFGGSLHKWKNQAHNYDTFRWIEFLRVYEEIIEEFHLDPYNVTISSLEGGLNNQLPDHLNCKARIIPENTMYLKGKPKKINRTRYPNEGYGLEIQIGECKYKVYDKGIQYKVGYEILRTECNCKTRPLSKHGLILFSDLLDYQKHLSFGSFLLEVFNTIIVAQPEILLNTALSMEDKIFILEYSDSNAWLKLRKKSDHSYQMARLRYFDLIDKYCNINYRNEVLKLMAYQIA